jgi:DNA primase
MIAPAFLDQLRARIPVSTVVGRRVRLRKAGREWRGLSPFNKERTPSFFVNDQKQFWHDFSSGRHGDVFGFVMETEGVGFREAVDRVAAMAGMAVELKNNPPAPATPPRREPNPAELQEKAAACGWRDSYGNGACPPAAPLLKPICMRGVITAASRRH